MVVGEMKITQLAILPYRLGNGSAEKETRSGADGPRVTRTLHEEVFEEKKQQDADKDKERHGKGRMLIDFGDQVAGGDV